MKRKSVSRLLILCVVLISGSILSLTSCNRKKTESTAEQRETTYYTCPMHPEIHKDETGDCPICGMPLVLKTDSASSTSLSQSDTSLPVDKQKIISSLPSIHPLNKKMQQKVLAEGTITYDTRQERNISTRYSGRIEKLYVKYMYQPVKQGEVLMDIYSPEMMTEQQDLIFLLSDATPDQQLVSLSKKKLMLLGMTNQQIKEVVETRQPLQRISVYSPYDGHIHEATAMNSAVNESPMNAPGTSELSLKEGMYVEKGQTIFNLLDPHMVWVALKIYSDDVQKVRLNEAVELAVEGMEMKLYGQIDFIEPFFHQDSKTLSARVYLDNEAHALKVGMYVRATIEADSVSGIWIPKEAMLDLGKRKMVWLKREKVFEAHMIVTGISSGDFVQVIEGLNESDEIASNAQYILDSESFVNN